MKHTCSSLVLHCIDFRFGPKIQEWLNAHAITGDVDTVSVAGAAKNLVAPGLPTDREFIIRQCDISKRLHDIQQIILLNHTDCGAYGGRSAFTSRDEEKTFHLQHLKEAASVLKEHLPGVKTKIVLADIEPTGEINFIEQA